MLRGKEKKGGRERERERGGQRRMRGREKRELYFCPLSCSHARRYYCHPFARNSLYKEICSPLTKQLRQLLRRKKSGGDGGESLVIAGRNGKSLEASLVGGWVVGSTAVCGATRQKPHPSSSICLRKEEGGKLDGGGRKKSPFDPRPPPPPKAIAAAAAAAAHKYEAEAPRRKKIGYIPPYNRRRRRRRRRRGDSHISRREGAYPPFSSSAKGDEGGRKGGFLSTPLLPLPCWKTEEDFRGEGKGKISSSSSVAAFLPSY